MGSAKAVAVAGGTGYLDLIRTANDAGRHLRALAPVAGWAGVPSPSELGVDGAEGVDWAAVLRLSRSVAGWSMTVAELLAQGRPIAPAAQEGHR